MNKSLKTLKSILITVVFASALQAQTPNAPTVADLLKRVDDLERQLKTVAAELAKIQQANESSPTKNKIVVPTSNSVTAKPTAATTTKTEPAAEKKKDLGVDVGHRVELGGQRRKEGVRTRGLVPHR